MESLVTSYASSDDGDEEEEENHVQQNHHENRRSSAAPPKPTSYLPPQPESVLSSSLFSSLPKPQSSKPSNHTNNNNNNFVVVEEEEEEGEEEEEEEEDPKPNFSSSKRPTLSLFASIPQPTKTPISTNPNPKRVVQFRPPVIPSASNSSNLDEDDDENERQRPRHSESLSMSSSSVKSFLSSIPAPRHSSTLGVLPSSAGSGRRSALQTEPAGFSSSGGFEPENEPAVDRNVGNYGNYEANYAGFELGLDQSMGNYESYGSYASSELGIGEHIDQNLGGGVDGSGYGSYVNYGDYGRYGSDSSDGTTAGPSEIVVRRTGKRGRDEMPAEVVEVKQDELMKNRPREDQVKLTGLAFGPSYQPASTKGKPSKLHKRKHQIGSLYHDMKQKEMELAERRAKGFLTKAQTQAKYGW